ncbi:MAG: TIGR01777 family oxidoreductase [Bryobacterales bacterium]|jgi:hypothetical protein|nr:TIGR01777 family oxidoreductase [Bryobacterales bacterium]
MRVTVTGGTGFVGSRLVEQLLASGWNVQLLTRNLRANLPAQAEAHVWDSQTEPAPAASLDGSDAVIHLMGEPVAQRWSPEIKRRIRDSRVLSTRNLVQAMSRMETRPELLVSASAIGYYGSRGDEVLTEDSAPGTDFLADVSQAWEQEALAAEALGVRVLRIRIGIVLGMEGGALERMLPPFRAGLGGPLGQGAQWMSWIHLDDLVGMMLFPLQYPHIRGVWNGASPNPVTNQEFTDTLARILKRPAIFRVPEFGLRLLFGEGSQALLGSQRVKPEAAEAAGFRFQYAGLHAALRHILRS